MLLKKISVIIPVYNEAETLPKTIEHLRTNAKTIPVEMIVVDGQSTDNTKSIAESCADRVLVSQQRGRGKQMHLGAQKASGDLLLFLHADTQLPSAWQEIIQNYFDKAGAAAAAFKLGFDSDQAVFKLIAYTSALRAKMTGVPQGDQALAVTKEIYHASGGFPDVPLMEEYFLLPKLRRFGRVQVLKESVRTSSRKYQQKGPIRNALKNFLLIFLFYLGVSPQKIAEWY